MKQRKIKFRAWHKNREEWVPMDAHFSFDTNNQLYQTDFKPIGLMQYTGLKDKNNVEIYEGDIVKYKNHIAKVSWNELAAGFWFESDIDLKDKTIKGSETEIIGNIYENKELLK